MKYVKYWLVLLFVFVVGVWLNVFLKKFFSTYSSESWEIIDLQTELDWVLRMFIYAHDNELIDFGEIDAIENLNIEGYGKELYYHQNLMLHLSWAPKILLLSDDGNFVDKQNNPIHVVVFEKRKVHQHNELSQLSRVYRSAAWSVGSDGINEYGYGDDVFIGFRWNGDFNRVRGSHPWWKFWQ